MGLSSWTYSVKNVINFERNFDKNSVVINRCCLTTIKLPYPQKVSIPTIPYDKLLCTHWHHENVVIYTIQVMYLNCIQRTIMDIIVDTSRCNDLTVLIQEKYQTDVFFWWQYQGHGTSCFKHFIFPSPIPISQNSLLGFWPPRPHTKAKKGISYERPQKIVWGSHHQ